MALSASSRDCPLRRTLVAWLVRHHLLFSLTAQKKDISDPQVIREFARTVGDQTHLDYPYLLTVADVRGTNPKLWNSWKSALFSDFYERTKRALRRGLEAPLDQEELVAEVCAAARDECTRLGLGAEQVNAVWTRFNDAYFLRHTPAEIAWHTGLLVRDLANPRLLRPCGTPRSAVQRRADAPATSSAQFRPPPMLDQMGLNILDARITPLEAA